MKLFEGLRKIRDFERGQLPFLGSVHDFDIVVEIGYEEERGRPVTLKKLYLLDICSRGTIRRKLAALIKQRVVIRRKHPTDGRASLLVIAPSTLKLLGQYGELLSSISESHFTR
jgi:DNA-binding MarR family transcriptional regulator